MRRQPRQRSVGETPLNQPNGAPFLSALEGNLGQSLDRQHAPGDRAGLDMQPLGFGEPSFCLVEVSRKQRRLSQQEASEASASERFRVFGHGRNSRAASPTSACPEALQRQNSERHRWPSKTFGTNAGLARTHSMNSDRNNAGHCSCIFAVNPSRALASPTSRARFAPKASARVSRAISLALPNSPL